VSIFFCVLFTLSILFYYISLYKDCEIVNRTLSIDIIKNINIFLIRKLQSNWRYLTIPDLRLINLFSIIAIRFGLTASVIPSNGEIELE
jgi:hypothetical protein